MISFSRILRSRVAWNASSSYLAFVSNACCGFLSIPVAVSFLNKEQIGLWAVVNSILSYLVWMDLGIGSATGRKMADAIAARDQGEVDKWWTATRAVLLVQGVVLAVIGTACIPFFIGLFRISSDLSEEAALLIAGAILLTALTMPLRGVPGLMTAQQRFHWIPICQAFTPWVQLGVFFAMLSRGCGMKSYLFSMAAVQVVTWCYFLILVKTGDLVPRWNRLGLDRARLRSLFGFSLNVSFLSASEAVISSIPNLILARFSGLSSVPVYVFTAKAPSLVTSLIRRTYHAFYPQLMNLHVSGRRDAFLRKHDMVGRLVLAFGAAGAASVLLFNRTVVGLLAGPDFHAEQMVTTWFALSVMITPVSGLFESLVQFSGNMGKSSLMASAKLVIGIGGAIAAYRCFGIAGVAAVFAFLPLVYAAYGYFRGSRRCGYEPALLSGRVVKRLFFYGAVLVATGWLGSCFDAGGRTLELRGHALPIPGPWTAAGSFLLLFLAASTGLGALRDLKAH